MLASHGSMQWRFHPLGDAFAVLAFAAFINKVSFKHRGNIEETDCQTNDV